MADTQENLETLQNLHRMLRTIAKNPVNIAIFVILDQIKREEGLIAEEIIKKVQEKFGKDSFGEDEIRYRLNRLASSSYGDGLIEKVYRTPGIIAPRYEYSLSADGQIIAKFFKEMMESLNPNIFKEE